MESLQILVLFLALNYIKICKLPWLPDNEIGSTQSILRSCQKYFIFLSQNTRQSLKPIYIYYSFSTKNLINCFYLCYPENLVNLSFIGIVFKLPFFNIYVCYNILANFVLYFIDFLPVLSSCVISNNDKIFGTEGRHFYFLPKFILIYMITHS